MVYQIVEDAEGLFWLTTNSGLVRFNPETKQVKGYTTANGLLGDQFNYRSSYKDETGAIYLGSIDGFVVFNPKTFTENKSLPPVVITDFMLFNKEVRADEENTPLEKSITFSDSITLQANQNSFSFRIAALGYQVPKMNKLMYRLDGFDKDWITVGESPIVTYSNLWHGDYVFRVKASNSDGIWRPEEHLLYIHILPPFYLSFWAYCIYILLFIVGSVYAFWYFKQRSSRLHRRQLEKFEQEKEREIYNAKIDFFTNVAHEIRTPLTLIKGPLENILLKKHLDPETHEDLNIMQHNTERLLNLTNQLLDFRKVESQGYSLNFTKCDITNILEETYMRFSSLSRQKGLDFNLELPEENFCAHVNREAFTKIISNLLNNGMKYADSYMHIKLEVDVETQAFYVVTKNDGVIIPDEMKEEIFQPFVRFSQKEEGKLATGVIFILCFVFVYLLLSAQYESYILPLSVLLSVPFGLLGSFLFVGGIGALGSIPALKMILGTMSNDIYMQIALIMLMGLLAKNAILIVEFALERRRMGMSITWAAVLGAAARLRPILMTSLAMIVGLLPLMFASGAGANGNRTLGTSAIGGMLIGMILQIFIVPALFVAFQYLQEKFKPMEWEDVDNSDAEPEIEQYTK